RSFQTINSFALCASFQFCFFTFPNSSQSCKPLSKQIILKRRINLPKNEDEVGCRSIFHYLSSPLIFFVYAFKRRFITMQWKMQCEMFKGRKTRSVSQVLQYMLREV
uniref:Uncharacterized protein n=1 Tax=Brassica oleracea var. oleracea TaxID=109376 RepID=A0A0D3ECX0_BRAOL